MKTLLIICAILLSISCSSSSSESKKKTRKQNLNVLIISFHDTDLNEVAKWSNHMPNYNIVTHHGATSVTSAQLDTQDVVILFSNHVSNTKAIGDSVYKYVMDGGHVILGTFYAQQAGSQTSGQDYGLLETITPTYHNKNAYRNDTLIVSGSHPILTGIDTLITYYGAGSDSIQNGGEELLTWNNGETLLAVNEPAGRLFNLSVFPSESRFNTVLKTASNSDNLENFFKLWASAIRFAHSLDYYADDFNYNPGDEGGGEVEEFKTDQNSAAINR